jgi:hypothetical protein
MTLATQMATDRAAFFSTDDFAVSATFTHTGSAAVAIKVIFNNAFELVNPMSGSIETMNPQAICKYSDVSAAAKNDTLVIGGVTYYCIGKAQRGEDGLTALLPLSKTQAP